MALVRPFFSYQPTIVKSRVLGHSVELCPFPHLDVLDGLGRWDALDGSLAAELLHLLAALRDGRWQLQMQESRF